MANRNVQLAAVFTANTTRFRSGVKEAEKSLGGFRGRMKQTTKSLMSFKGALGGIAVGATIREFGRLSDRFTTLKTQIENVTDSQDEYNKVLSGLSRIAQTNGASLEGLASTYNKLNISLPEAVKNQTDLLKVTDLLAKGFAASGTNAQTASGALLQLTQGLAGNFKSAGQELNSIIEGAPLLAKAISEQLGGESAADLKRFAEQGKITSQVFLDALLASEDVINSYEIPPTISRSWQRVKNEILLIVGAINEATNASGFFSGILDQVANITRDIRVGFDLIGKTIEIVSAKVQQFFNDLLVSLQNFYNTAAVRIENLTRGAVEIPLSGSVYDRDFSARIANAEQELLQLQENVRDSNNETLESTQKVFDSLGESTEKSEKDVKKIERAMQDYSRSIMEVRRNQQQMTDEIADTLFDLGTGYESLRDTAVRALNEIMRSMFRLSMGGTATGGLFGQIGESIFGAIVGSPGANSITTASNGASVPVPLSKPSFATGIKTVPYDMTAKIHKGERIVPAQQSKKMDGDVTVNVINNGDSQVSTRERQGVNGMEIDVMIENIVANKINTSGSRINRSLQQFSNLEATRR